ncbi:hypothetical protein FQN51_006394 [Onygenales sp. PD_10]|nr:hypothetical protein FQN51_006394 [Onygenales sp. PD_10]
MTPHATDASKPNPHPLPILGSNNPNISHPASTTRPMFSDEWPITSPSGYTVSDHMINEPPPSKAFKIAMIGAGAAGIDFLHHATHEFKGTDVEYVCFEKNHDVGGTWLENRYPGCACDVPSASYQFPWRPKPDWSMYYSPAREIWQYMRDIVDEEGLMEYIRLRTKVCRAEWVEERSRWVVGLVESDGDGRVVREWEEECDVLLNGNGILNEEQKEEWRKNPEEYRKYRKMIEDELNNRFRFTLRNSKESDESNAYAYHEMRTKLGNNETLKDKIIPKNFNVGCRRPTPGNGYLEALVGEKTTCYTGTIGGITPKGFLTSDGTEVEVDVIICATGFDTSFRPRFPIIGLDKVDIATRWEKIPETYLAVSVSNVPNYFMYNGPYGPVAQGSILPLITLYTNHFLQIIRKMRKEHIRRLSPKESAVKDFCEHAAIYLQRTCWADPCSSWFKQGRKDGNIVMWPGSRLAFFDMLAEPRFEDYEIEYWSKNRWGFMGNGFTTGEFDGDDISKYLNGRIYPDF